MFEEKPFVIYRSSAGSGKTRTLAKAYLTLALRYKADYYSHILAVTFTNKATQEMKDRILEYLDNFARGQEDALATELMTELKMDAPTFRERCQEAQREILHGYSRFAISTIDAFFQKVIRSFTREAGLMGDYRLEVEEEVVLEEVINNLVDELGTDPDLTDWVVEFARENLENDKAWDVRQNLIRFCREIFREEFHAIEESLIQSTADRNFFKTYRQKLWAIKNHFFSLTSPVAEEVLSIIDRHLWTVGHFSYGKNSGLLTFFQQFAFNRSLSKIKNPSDRMRNYFTVAKNWPGKNTQQTDQIMAVAEAELIPLLKRILTLYDQHYARALTAEVMLRNFYAFGLIADASRKLREYKTQNNVMLLADAPNFLNHIITDSDTPFIYEKVGSFYRNYLIDEFQDTSGLQWKNFLPLLLNSLDQGYPGMIVGDVKQAIYRWRGGNLGLLQREVASHIGKDRVDVRTLSTNFRSAPEIIQFNNALFGTAAALVGTKMSSTLPPEAFLDVRQAVARNEYSGVIDIQLFDDEKEKPWINTALEKIPEWIERLQLAGVKANEIAILVRKNSEGQLIASWLHEYVHAGKGKDGCRYDVVSSDSLRVDTASSVKLIIAAMRYLFNAEDVIARAQLVYECARYSGDTRPLTEVFAVTNLATFESNLPNGFTSQKSFLKKMPLIELTEMLAEIFQLGKQHGEMAYFLEFQNLILDYYTRERNDLGAFLEWWDENAYKKSIILSGNVDAMTIITIHKAKGLQYPYVLVPFCSWYMDHEGDKAPLLWVKSEESPFKEAGYVPVNYSSTLKETLFHEAYEEEQTRTYLDNLNLVYVAFTRAERGLFVGGPFKPDKKENDINTAARLLYESLLSTPSLSERWEAHEHRWTEGQLKVDNKSVPEANLQIITLNDYAARSWRDKLVIRRSGFRGLSGDGQSSAALRGLVLHQLLSQIKIAGDFEKVMELGVMDGLVSSDEQKEFEDLIRGVLSNPEVSKWFDGSWDVRTEVPILLPSGLENRIDRLMLKDRHAVIVDYKTGEPSREDQHQVQEYMELLRQMNFAQIEGYLLYLRDQEIIAVAGGKAKRKPKKDVNQLELGI